MQAARVADNGALISDVSWQNAQNNTPFSETEMQVGCDNDCEGTLSRGGGDAGLMSKDVDDQRDSINE